MNIYKNKHLIMGVLLLLALAGSGTAADISGKWVVPSDDVTIEFVFKVDGTTCTGTAYNPKFGEIALKECKIEGDTINFIVTRIIASNEYKNVWKGKISGDKIEFTNTTQEIKRTTALRNNPSSLKSVSSVDLSGKWTARLQNGNKVELVFIVEGDKFTGILNNSSEGQKEIASGKITGKNISFLAMGDDSKLRWDGIVSGDEIQFMTVAKQDSRQLTAVKASANPSAKTPAARLNLSGRWAGRVPGGGAKFDLSFRVDGNTFAGTVTNDQLGEAVILDGKIDGDIISFYVPRNDSKAQWKGRVVGDEIRMTLIGRDGTPVSLTVTKVSSDSGGRAASADLSGKWTSDTPDGAKIEMYFIAKGAAFTGVMAYSKGGEIAIKDGSINGSDISFYIISKNVEKDESKVNWKGKVAGDEIKFTYTISGDGPKQITFRRERPKPNSELAPSDLAPLFIR
jgi:type 1 fimbria pilin